MLNAGLFIDDSEFSEGCEYPRVDGTNTNQVHSEDNYNNNTTSENKQENNNKNNNSNNKNSKTDNIYDDKNQVLSSNEHT